MKFIRIRIPILLVLVCATTNGQNLIKDPSFEQKNDCPTSYSSLNEDAKHWNAPTLGTTDYFSECSDQFAPQNNFIGTQKPKHGKSFAGIYLYAPNDYREYLTTELKEKLVKGKTYTISFMVNLPEEVEYAMNNFSVLFTKNKLSLSTSKNIKIKRILKNRKSNFKNISTSNYVSDESSWHKVSTTIVANGYEHYMTIGNFKNNQNTNVQSVRKKSRKSSYYFIDMVSVEKEKPFSLDEFYIFDNFVFDIDKVDFDQQNSEQLNKLVSFLQEHPNVQISLNGHTDASGSVHYNKKLSAKRAKQVAMFLVDNGLKMNRVKWKGLGEKKPIADNSTSNGKLKNRRVEFILTEKKYKDYASNTFEDE